MQHTKKKEEHVKKLKEDKMKLERQQHTGKVSNLKEITPYLLSLASTWNP